MNNTERGSHVRDVYSTQDTSRMETARVEEDEDKNNSVRGVRNMEGRKERGHYIRKKCPYNYAPWL